MHRKLALGAFAVFLSAGLAQAQTSTTGPTTPVDLVVPEGFTLQTTPLTAEALLGATIYDIGGDSIGEVHDLIFAAPDAGTANGAAPDTTAPGTGTDTGTAADGMAPDATASPDTGTGTATADKAGQITHAILDIGGFLGMGQHRIALPVSDLRIYSSDSGIRVYLPWTREQLTALPAYDENDPSTLGHPLLTP